MQKPSLHAKHLYGYPGAPLPQHAFTTALYLTGAAIADLRNHAVRLRCAATSMTPGCTRSVQRSVQNWESTATPLCRNKFWRRGWDSNPRYGYPYNGFRVLRFSAGVCRPVAKRVLLFGISKPMILVCVAQCRPVLRGWFAIWFANFIHQPMSALGGKRTSSCSTSRYTHMKTCPDCNGDGVVDKDTDDERQCPTCGGLGFVPDDDDDHEEVIKTSRDLPHSVGSKP